MLRFVIGPAMSGKTRYLQLDALKHDGALFIVPEQFAFETEKMLLELGGAGEAHRVRVLTLSRMAHGLGADGCRTADAAAKLALTKIAIKRVADALEFYRGQASRPDFAAMTVGVLRRFKKAGLTPPKLGELALRTSESLKYKLNDFSLIAASCGEVMADRYFDPDDGLLRLADTLREKRPFSGAHIYLDAFSDFNAAEYGVLRELLEQSAEFTVSLDGDRGSFSSGGEGLFDTPKRTYLKLRGFAARENIGCSEPVYLSDTYINTPSLKAAEKAFRGASSGPLPDDGGVRVCVCDTQHSEAERLASNIANLIRETGWRYNDVAVICRDPEAWRGLADRRMTEYGIPFFWDRRKPLSGTPVCRFLLLALSVCTGGSAADLTACLKSGFSTLDAADVCRLENYAFTHNIRTLRDWKKTWDDPEFEALRKAAAEPVFKLSDALRDCSPKEFSEAVYAFTEELGVADRLAGLAELGRDRRLETVMTDPVRAYNALIELLDSFAETLDLRGLRLSSGEYAEIFRLMASAVTIGEIPQYIDAVHFGGAGLMRTADIKAVFVIGANEDVFPAPPDDLTPFTPGENRILNELGAEMDRTVADMAAAEQLLVYSSCFCASERLTVSYSLSDASGTTALYPSAFVKKFEKLLPETSVINDRRVSLAERAVSPVQTAGLAGEAGPVGLASITEALRRSGENELADRMEKAASPSDERRAAGTAAKLYSGRPYISASKIENYIACRFRYFCAELLKAQKLRPAALDSQKYGDAYHKLMEVLFSRHSPESLASMEEEELSRETSQCLEENYPDLFVRLPESDARAAFFAEKMKRSAAADVRKIAEMLAGEGFRPAAFEIKISGDDALDIPDGPRVGGKADHADLYTDRDGARWLRVVDYKTGRSEHAAKNEILKGLRLQLIYYLQALCESGKFAGARPAGFYYCTLGSRGGPAMRGVRSDDPALDPAFSSSKGLACSRIDTGMTLEELTALADGYASMTGKQLSQGVFDASPADDGKCARCDYRHICYRIKNSGEEDGDDDAE